MSREGHGEPAEMLPPQALDVYERFVAAMRARDVGGARDLAPGVEIVQEGWPYRNETGPLNPDAFAGPPEQDRIVAVTERGPGRYAFGSPIAWFEVERTNDAFRIVDGGLKPME